MLVGLVEVISKNRKRNQQKKEGDRQPKQKKRNEEQWLETEKQITRRGIYKEKQERERREK